MCGWFTFGWLRMTIQIESFDSSIFSSRSLRRLRSITSKCWHIARTNTHREMANDRMWIGNIIIGGHMTNPSCLSRSRDRTTLPSIIRTWGDITRDRWLQSGTELTLRINWVSHYHTPRCLWMSWHMYHIYIRMLERLAFNKTIYSYLNSSHNLCYRIKKSICRWSI
jgi:hypothetical protein